MLEGKYNQNNDDRNPYSKGNLAKRGLVPGWLYWVGFGLGFFWGWVFRWAMGDPVLQFNNSSIHDPVKLSYELHSSVIRERPQPEIISVMLERPVMFRVISEQRGNLADPIDAMLLTLENRSTAQLQLVSFQKSKPVSGFHFSQNAKGLAVADPGLKTSNEDEN